MKEYFEKTDNKSFEKRAKNSCNKHEKNVTILKNETHESFFKNTYLKQLMLQNNFSSHQTFPRTNGKLKRAPGQKSRRGTTLEAKEMPFNKIVELILNGDLLLKNVDYEQEFKTQKLI